MTRVSEKEFFRVKPFMLLHPSNRPTIEAYMRSMGIPEVAIQAEFVRLRKEG